MTISFWTTLTLTVCIHWSKILFRHLLVPLRPLLVYFNPTHSVDCAHDERWIIYQHTSRRWPQQGDSGCSVRLHVAMAKRTMLGWSEELEGPIGKSIDTQGHGRLWRIFTHWISGYTQHENESLTRWVGRESALFGEEYLSSLLSLILPCMLCPISTPTLTPCRQSLICLARPFPSSHLFVSSVS